MLNNASGFQQIYIACGRTDMRRGIDGLATLVKRQFHLSPFQEDTLFLFCGRKQDRIKGLVWEGDGFVLLYKRVEAGRLQWPRCEEDVLSITQEQLQALMDGFSIVQKSTLRKAQYQETA